MVRAFVQDWNRTRPPDTGRFTGNGEIRTGDYLGAVTWLAAETRRLGAPLSRDRIESVMKGTTRTTELRVADAIVQAIDRPFAFHDGTLEIQPNPRAKAAAQAQCCGGAGVMKANAAALTGVVSPRPF